MASIRKEILLETEPSLVWGAVRDVGAVHLRLARDFVSDTQLDGDERLVTFINGVTVRERIVTVDDVGQRLVYAVVGGRLSHHNASFQVFDDGEGRARLVWVADLMPDEEATSIDAMMNLGVEAIRRTLGPNRA